MGIEIRKGKVSLSKELTDLDRFVLDVVGLIEEFFPYVIVSGYVTIRAIAWY